MAAPRTFYVLDSIRFALEVTAFIALGIWGFTQFEQPMDWAVGLGAPLLAVIVAALFVSPKAVVQLDVYGRGLVEILLYSAGGLALVVMGHAWFALGYIALGAIVGVTRGVLSISSNVTD